MQYGHTPSADGNTASTQSAAQMGAPQEGMPQTSTAQSYSPGAFSPHEDEQSHLTSTPLTPVAKPLIPAKFPLIRPYKGRIFAGVCRGISVHLGIPVWIIRLLFFIGIFFGLGVVAYIFRWATVPAADVNWVAFSLASQTQQTNQQAALSHGNVPVESSRKRQTPYDAVSHSIAQTLSTAYTPALNETTEHGSDGTQTSRHYYDSTHASSLTHISIWNTLGLILVSVIVMYVMITMAIQHGYIRPVVGAALIISAVVVMLEWVFFERFQINNKLAIALVALVAFLMLTSIILHRLFGHTDQFPVTLWLMGISMVTVALIAAPWIAESNRNLAAQTAQKEREEERADMAAHLHDSVLQTLNLIRQNASDAQTVSRLARTQERELRRWLYEDREAANESIASSMKLICAQVEDTFGKEIDVITVGDAQPTNQTQALVEATKQALTNACTHGAEPFSLYVESRLDTIEVFVRDHGDGFDPDNIPYDRMGIRHSIKGRLERAGGTVKIVSRPRWGTEVRMKLSSLNHTTNSYIC